MRIGGYLLTFLAISLSVALTILSQTLPEWIHFSSPKNLPFRMEVRYGLFERCELDIIGNPPIYRPANHTSNILRVSRALTGGYSSYTCRPFPSSSECSSESSKDNLARIFCILWRTAAYASIIGIGMAAVSCVATVASSCTGSRRRKDWTWVAIFMAIRVVFQFLAIGLVVHLWKTWDVDYLQYGNLGTSFYLSLSSSILDVFIVFGVIVTGLAAEAGHTWAAGRRAYRPIQ